MPLKSHYPTGCCLHRCRSVPTGQGQCAFNASSTQFAYFPPKCSRGGANGKLGENALKRYLRTVQCFHGLKRAKSSQFHPLQRRHLYNPAAVPLDSPPLDTPKTLAIIAGNGVYPQAMARAARAAGVARLVVAAFQDETDPALKDRKSVV